MSRILGVDCTGLRYRRVTWRVATQDGPRPLTHTLAKEDLILCMGSHVEFSLPRVDILVHLHTLHQLRRALALDVFDVRR